MHISICSGKRMCSLFVSKNRENHLSFWIATQKIFFIKIHLEFENVYLIYEVK